MTSMKWTLKTVPLKTIKGWAKNPRKMSARQAEKLEESMKKFGVCQPLVVNRDMTVIGGHQRLITAKNLGITEIEVYIPEKKLSDKEFEELNIRLNKNNGFFDYDILANEFECTDLLEWGFSLEEFEVESVPYDESKENKKPPSKKSKMTILFQSEEDLQSAENRISTIVDEFEGASYKIKLGG